MNEQQDVFVKILESHIKHQELVEKRLLEMAKTLDDTNARMIRFEASGFDARLIRLSERMTLLENEQMLRNGGSRLLDKIPGWVGWMAAIAIAFYEYLRVTKGP